MGIPTPIEHMVDVSLGMLCLSLCLTSCLAGSGRKIIAAGLKEGKGQHAETEKETDYGFFFFTLLGNQVTLVHSTWIVYSTCSCIVPVTV